MASFYLNQTSRWKWQLYIFTSFTSIAESVNVKWGEGTCSWMKGKFRKLIYENWPCRRIGWSCSRFLWRVWSSCEAELSQRDHEEARIALRTRCARRVRPRWTKGLKVNILASRLEIFPHVAPACGCPPREVSACAVHTLKRVESAPVNLRKRLLTAINKAPPFPPRTLEAVASFKDVSSICLMVLILPPPNEKLISFDNFRLSFQGVWSGESFVKHSKNSWNLWDLSIS